MFSEQNSKYSRVVKNRGKKVFFSFCIFVFFLGGGGGGGGQGFFHYYYLVSYSFVKYSFLKIYGKSIDSPTIKTRYPPRLTTNRAIV